MNSKKLVKIVPPIFAAFLLSTSLADAQAPVTTAAPGAAPQGFRMRETPYDYADNEGFTSMFDGKSLNGWDQDPRFWSVKDGAIYVQATCEKPTGTIYAVWQGGEASDFILKYEFKGTQGINGGMQFRSYLTADSSVAMKYPPRPPRPPAPAPAAGAAPGAQAGGAGPRPPACANPGTRPTAAEEAKWDMFGPQADYDGNNNYSGMFYEQGGRAIIATPGHAIYSEAGKPVKTIATLADKATLDSWFKKEDWNQFIIIAKGNSTSIFMNGHLVTQFIDTDPTYFRAGGKIGLEVEATGEFWARNIWIKKF